VARAKERFDTLQAEVIEFQETSQIAVEVGPDPDTGGQFVNILQPSNFPREWGLTVGEIVGHCTSALNYLVVAFVGKGPGKPDRANEFPISEDRDAYFRKGRSGVPYRDRLLMGVPEEVRKKIDDLQPWSRVGPAFRDELAVLKSLRNASEHRELGVAYLGIETPRQIIMLSNTHAVEGLTLRFSPEGVVKGVKTEFSFGNPNDEIGVTFGAHPKVDMNRPIRATPLFGSVNEPVRRANLYDLRRIIDWAGAIIKWFSPDLDARAPK
jgi:hypothetical protein